MILLLVSTSHTAVNAASGSLFKISDPEDSLSVMDRVIQYGKSFVGKPYCYKGPSAWKMDCSGYLSHLYSTHNISIPHSAAQIARNVIKIDFADVKKGDFLFFKGRDLNRSTVGHISMVIEVSNGFVTMMHSCQRGILIERYDKLDYYKRRFLFAGRLPFHLQQFAKEENLYTMQASALNKDTISIIGVGDMMLGTNYPAGYLPPEDGKELLTPVKDILIDADLTFGNMEGTLLSGEGNMKTCSNPATCYAFKSPDHYITYFKEAGFDVLSLANNHSGDFGTPGKINTVRLLKENAIEFAGLLEYPYTIFTKDSVTYGFCAFAPNNGTVSINDRQNAVGIVRHLDSLCDMVIVSFHGGAEGVTHRNITKKNEIYLGENRGNPYQFSRDVIDAGADIVFGHGPHVTRAIDLYKGRFIAYSLGNFATYGRFNLRGATGHAPIIKVYVNKKGEFIQGQIISTKQIGEGGPILDPDQSALNEIISLTQTDLPESNLVIGTDGLVKTK
ncbi:MAG: CapA family protein [Cytophagaceae bacterium]|nr:CapA family protein [Cytophagaceae bacterium]